MLALGLLLTLAAPAPPPVQGVTVLIGVADDRPAGELSGTPIADVRRSADSIILLRSHEGSLRAVWIPRDAVLRLPGGKRVVASQALKDGPEHLDAAMAHTLGIRPQSHALLDFDGFGALVDAVGGVRWPGGPSAAGLPRRAVHLGGRAAVRYVLARRGDARADLARIRRQMLLSQAFAAALPETGVGGILRAAAILPRVGRTDLSAGAAAELTLSLAREPLECAIAPGRPEGGRYRLARGAAASVRRMLGIRSGGQHQGRRRAAAGLRLQVEVPAQGFREGLRDGEA